MQHGRRLRDEGARIAQNKMYEVGSRKEDSYLSPDIAVGIASTASLELDIGT